jgi:quinol monooxygenase YgiN
MRNSLCRWLVAALLPLALTPLAQSQTAGQPDGPAYIVSYFETSPGAAAQARKLLASFARASRKDAGNRQSIALQRIHAPNHFAVLETWDNKAAQAAHAETTATREFHAKLEPLLRSPYDERPHFTFVADMPSAEPIKSAVYVVTHVDIIPASKDVGLQHVKDLVAESRKDPGMLAFNALQQSSRPNHVSLIEVWKDAKSLDGHGVAAHMRDFRAKFMPLSGSLYDERLYKAID